MDEIFEGIVVACIHVKDEIRIMERSYAPFEV